MTIHQRTTEPDSAAVVAFPSGFRWGAATAAYQIEGAVNDDGRKPSIWDTFSHTPGTIVDGTNADLACDHYHRYRDDVRLMADLGLSAYRFSIAWPRVQPDGRGPANQAGLDFYGRLIDELLANGIEPWPTLYHWDLPQALQDAGGWPERDTAARFADYAVLVDEALGDRVSTWTTLNEPWCSAFLGYCSGDHAPGRRDGAAAIRAAHHLLLGHGLAVQALHTAGNAGDVGITLNLYAVTPASNEPDDVDAARRIDGLANRIFLDPVLRNEYPADVLEDLRSGTDFDHVHDDDMQIIGAPLSFLGVNYYSRYVVAAPRDASSAGMTSSAEATDLEARSPWPGSETVEFVSRDMPVTDMGWNIDPAGLVETLCRLHREYPPLPLYVTENGAAFTDTVGPDGQVYDSERLAYIESHLAACQEAIGQGVPLGGYFAWSLMDNFEWSHGFSKRFGLIHVDYADQRRRPKSSALWYADVIRRNGLQGPGR